MKNSKDIRIEEIIYQFEAKYGNNWFMKLLARYLGIRRMYNWGIMNRHTRNRIKEVLKE